MTRVLGLAYEKMSGPVREPGCGKVREAVWCKDDRVSPSRRTAMRRIAVVGLLLLSMFLLMAGCATGGATEGGGEQFDTEYSIEQGRYVPVEGTQEAQGEVPAEGSEAK